MPRGFLFFVKMRTYSNIFIHIPGFTKSDLEFISNSTTHEEVTLLAATCGMFIEKIHFYDPSTIPLHNQYEMKLVDTDVFEIAMFLDEIKAYETVYIGSRRISGNGAHLIHVSIRYNKEEYTSNVTIDRKSGDPRVINEAYPSLFSFNRADLAYKFHKNFKDLLKEASPLLF